MKIQILSRVKFNGNVYENGDVIEEITDQYGLELVEAGAAKELTKSKSTQKREKAQKSASKKKDAEESDGPSEEMSHKELDAMAKSFGIDSTKMRNKAAKIAAINEARDNGSDADGEEDAEESDSDSSDGDN